MKKVLMIIICIVMTVGLVACQGALNTSEDNDKEINADNTLKIGTSGGYHPYTFMNDNQELDGFEIDVWNEIGKRAGYEVEFTASAFAGLFGMLDAGRIHTIANQIAITEERMEKYSFTEPYVFSGSQILVKGDNDSITNIEDLKEKKVGVSLGSNYEKDLREYDVNNEIEIITYEDYAGSIQDVAMGRIDAMVNDRLAAMMNIEESGLDVKLGGEPIAVTEIAVPFVKKEKNNKMIKKINDAILSMHEDGTFTQISNKWFEVDITSRD